MTTVLIVDDEYGIAELLEAVLVDEGHRVLTASNGKHGLQVLETEKPDLIFLDYMMPVMDGATMLSRMAQDESLRMIPVVLMSSISEATVAERCKGYALFLRKPFNVFHVIDVVKTLTAQGVSSATSDNQERGNHAVDVAD
jgi:CheY-like chemotaxis protein